MQVDSLLVGVLLLGIFYGFHISQHLIRINQFIFTKPSDVAWLPWACVLSWSLTIASAFPLICCLLHLSQCTISAGSARCNQANPLATLVLLPAVTETPNNFSKIRRNICGWGKSYLVPPGPLPRVLITELCSPVNNQAAKYGGRAL